MRNETVKKYNQKARLSGVFAALVLVFTSGVACLPEEARVERSIEIAAPVGVIFEQVVDLKKNEAWSPWAAHDSTMVATYGATTRGVGATSSWTSEEMGSGSMEITRVVPNSRVEVALDFKEEGKAESFWSFEPQGDVVKVTWGFVSRPDGFGAKVFALMMDSFVGPYYEEGLEKLKGIAESKSGG
ncbi:MAG: SRPBCC family protein [bacterium]|nr:SRPBCC family protein [bacterium]